ncbi:FMN reductase [Corynebacterium sanguinis]|uniref:FMN reductase n=1 Tax=Corynebacterium TaxID=1716 RepID=UPI00223BECFF|nr:MULTISPECIES: FMN reductase [Corynebacterium]MCT1554416.1 FMN reductase [Corynebacterium sanguinis]MCT1584104.1 FMN reductase [Corynebacterium sanguinis]MCT2022688.1 FMN reductase [Corynebacterium sanguinis]MCT2046546.1 FMN reductase [Corynebacterium sanguinis]WNI12338.1 FMN reductase [Corynebacterium sp. Z-1]
MKRLIVLSAGLSTPSTTRQVADTIANAVSSAVGGRGEKLEVTTIELRELTGDLAQHTSTGMSTPRLDEVKTQLSEADALVAVTPVFKASYTGLFKMFFDVLDTDALNGMPTIIAATAGTARHSLVTEYAMRPLLTYMRAVVVPTSLFAATDDFGGPEGADFNKRVARAAAELARLIVATEGSVGGLAGAVTDSSADVPPRKRKAGVDVTDDFIPFSELLRGHRGE